MPYNVAWCGEWAEDPGDDEILALAHREGRVLVTLDKDFGELAVVRRQSHSGIVRLVGFAAQEQPVGLAVQPAITQRARDERNSARTPSRLESSRTFAASAMAAFYPACATHASEAPSCLARPHEPMAIAYGVNVHAAAAAAGTDLPQQSFGAALGSGAEASAGCG